MKSIRSPPARTAVATAALFDTEPELMTRRGHTTSIETSPTRSCWPGRAVSAATPSRSADRCTVSALSAGRCTGDSSAAGGR